MASEVGEVIDVLAHTGHLTFRILDRAEWAAEGLVGRVAQLVRFLYKKYALCGQVKLRALARDGLMGLTSVRMPAEHTGDLRRVARNLSVPYALTHSKALPGEIILTLRKQDYPAMQPVLQAIGIGREIPENQQARVLNRSQDSAFMDGPAALEILRMEKDEGKASRLKRRCAALDIPIASQSESESGALNGTSSERRDTAELLVFPAEHEASIRKIAGEIGIRQVEIRQAAQPLGPERISFRARQQRRRSREQQAVQQRTPTQEHMTQEEVQPKAAYAGFARCQVPVEKAEAVTGLLNVWSVECCTEQTGGKSEIFVRGQDTEALISALRKAKVAAAIAPVSPERLGQLEAAHTEVADMRDMPIHGTTMPHLPDGQFEDCTARGLEKIRQQSQLTNVLALQAENPGMSFENICSLIGQGHTVGASLRAEQWLQMGAWICPEARMVWTGDLQRGADGRMKQTRDEKTGKLLPVRKIQGRISVRDVEGLAEDWRKIPDPAEIVSRLGANIPKKLPLMQQRQIASNLIFQESIHRLERLSGSALSPLEEQQAALAAGIVLHRLRLPIPKECDEAALGPEIRLSLNGTHPFTAMEKARRAAVRILKDVEMPLRTREQDRSRQASRGEER